MCFLNLWGRVENEVWGREWWGLLYSFSHNEIWSYSLPEAVWYEPSSPTLHFSYLHSSSMTKCLLDVLSSLDLSLTLSSRLDYLNTCTASRLDCLNILKTEVWIPLSAPCNIILPGNPHFSKRHLQLPTCSGEKSRSHPWILFPLTFPL